MADNRQLPDKIQIQSAQLDRRWPQILDSPEPANKQNISGNRGSLSGFAKGIFIGGILATVATVLLASKIGMNLGNAISKREGSIQNLPGSNSESGIEHMNGTKQRAKSGRAWRVIFYVASGIAMFADSRRKKI